jgi:3-deoxy-D-manno-octulosonic-acid transferase
LHDHRTQAVKRLAYNAALHAILPVLPLRLWWRGRREPLYRADVGQRFGRYGERPGGPLLWVHAVSLGETRAAQPLVRALRERYPDHRLLLTHMTATGRAAARELYPDALVSFLPYDFPWAVARFLDHFRPRLGVLMETEIWFNLVRAAEARGIPMLLANARLSARSARGYARAGVLVRDALGALDIGAQSADDASRLQHLGARAVTVTGNLKFDITPPENVAERAAALRALYGARPVFLAGSTREGEETLLLDALAARPLDALTVIVPRHPQRFDEVAALLAKRGLAFVRRSEGRAVPADCRFVLGDSMGEMFAYYAASDVALIGGSLLDYGAQNLIEAAAVGAPILIGPSSFNFADATTLAIEAGAAMRVTDAADAVAQAAAILGNGRAQQRMSEAGKAFAAAHTGATRRTMALVERLLAARA